MLKLFSQIGICVEQNSTNILYKLQLLLLLQVVTACSSIRYLIVDSSHVPSFNWELLNSVQMGSFLNIAFVSAVMLYLHAVQFGYNNSHRMCEDFNCRFISVNDVFWIPTPIFLLPAVSQFTCCTVTDVLNNITTVSLIAILLYVTQLVWLFAWHDTIIHQLIIVIIAIFRSKNVLSVFLR